QLKAFIKVIPPFLISMDGVAFIFKKLNISCIDGILWMHSELFGHSIILLAYISYFSYRFKVCAYTWSSITALSLLNILNIIFFFLPLDYYKLYAVILISYGIAITVLYAIQSNTRNRPRGII